MDEELSALSAATAAALIAAGKLTAEELAGACLAAIAAREPEVAAWQFVDRDHARREAQARDAERRAGRPQGPLHGIPVGIKDIIDTADMPTENGTTLHAGRQPARDAAVVARLRAAGAVILGKTVTTEFAAYHPGKTRHPLDPTRTPGGSSSGSAAAVAARMVPLAIGSQTNGSVIRPAAYCGVVGFKPTFGLISRAGMLSHQRALDHVGVFARTVEDVALIAEALVGHDPEDADTRPLAAPALLATCRADPPAPPRLALVRAPWSDRQEPEASAAFADLAEALGGHVTELRLGPEFAASLDHHRVLHETGLAFHLAADFDRGGAAMSAKLGAMIEGGRRHSALAYVEALAAVPRYLAELDGVFDEFDAILVPATTGVAPRGLESTGDPVFCTLWTLCGVPAVTLPLLENGDGLPIGVQLVGPQHGDARLLRTARWLAQLVAGQARRTRTTSGRRRTRPA